VGWVVLAIVAVTLAALVLRPRGLGEAWAAAAGAIAMFLAGAVGPADVVATLRETWDVLAFLLGMMALTWLAEEAGVFDRLAGWVARGARGNGLALFALVFALAAAVTALLSLDVTVLILTPVVYALTVRLRLDALPFMFACTFVANTGSLLLPISNLTNLLVYSQLGLGFGDFAARMWLPNLVAILVNFAIFLWLFRERLPERFDPLADNLPPADWWLATAAVVLTATLAGLLALGLLRLPLAWAALAGGATLFVVGLAGRRTRAADAARAISWPLFIFVLGMFLVVRGFEHLWLDRLRIALPADPTVALALAACGNALGSNIVNNVPMTLLSLSLIARAAGPAREAMAYGALVGANIGPTLTTFGSLATMLWLTLIRRRGLDVSAIEYMKVALLTTPAVLAAATAALWLALR
jgi:arsenical pump membrane protein